MNSVVFALPKPKLITKKILTYLSIAVLAGALLGGFFWSWKTDRLPEIDLRMFLAKLTLQSPKDERLVETGEGAVIATEAKVYEETAEAGEGITHLARKALKKYLADNKTDFELTPEHKIYIEDYLQNKTGDRWLSLGEKITFSQELIEEAINTAQKLTSEQLENLQQYSALVSSL